MSRLANALLHIRGTYPALRPAEKRVAQVILSDPREAVHYSITQLAEKAEVSDATVVKFCKRLGYKGYQEFKIMLAQDVAVKPQLIHGEVEPGNDVQMCIRDRTRIMLIPSTKALPAKPFPPRWS